MLVKDRSWGLPWGLITVVTGLCLLFVEHNVSPRNRRHPRVGRRGPVHPLRQQRPRPLLYLENLPRSSPLVSRSENRSGPWKCELLRARRTAVPSEQPTWRPLRPASRRRFRIGLTITLILAFVPILPCPVSRWCQDDLRIWTNYINSPRVTPQQAAAVRRWAADHGCRYCGNLGWTSAFRSRWNTLRDELRMW
jgi:hypothetical protein